MMPLPNIPMGTSRLANWMHRIQKAIEADRIASITGGEMKQTPRGTMLVFKPGTIRQETTSAINFAEYSTTGSNAVNDIRCIYSGPNKGTYICVKARTATTPDSDPVPPSDPRHGTYWCQFVVSDSVGKWT